MLATKGLCYLRKQYYSIINQTISYKKTRWLITILLLALYFQRVRGMSYDVITYVIFFYIIQLIINYFTPKGIAEEQQEEQQNWSFNEQQVLLRDLQHQSDKPLTRSMNEMQIWQRVTFVFVLGLICTLFKAFQIDVFWPVLMVYIVILFCYTIHKIVTKMQKYRYNANDFSKKSMIY